MDKLKFLFFFAVIVAVSIYPVLEVKNQPKPKKYENQKIIPTVIEKGKYFVYEENLTKKGSFEILEIYKKNLLKAFDFKLINIKKQEKLFSKKVLYKKPILDGTSVFYSNKDYNITTDFAKYNQKTKILKGGKFKLYSLSYKAFGKSFIVDKEKNIYATKIKYYLKVK